MVQGGWSSVGESPVLLARQDEFSSQFACKDNEHFFIRIEHSGSKTNITDLNWQEGEADLVSEAFMEAERLGVLFSSRLIVVSDILPSSRQPKREEIEEKADAVSRVILHVASKLDLEIANYFLDTGQGGKFNMVFEISG